jgi:hypothetical protein
MRPASLAPRRPAAAPCRTGWTFRSQRLYRAPTIHAAYIFTDLFDYYVRDQRPNMAFTVFVIAAAMWAMPLLFLTSGMTLSYALRKRSPAAFVVERAKRLLVPFIFGVVVVIPPMTYLELLGRPGDHPSYWPFLSRFFDVRPAWDFPYLFAGRTERFETAHLYFLCFLFVFSLLLLPPPPLLLFLRRPRDRCDVGLPGCDPAVGHPAGAAAGMAGGRVGGWMEPLGVLPGGAVALPADGTTTTRTAPPTPARCPARSLRPAPANRTARLACRGRLDLRRRTKLSAPVSAFPPTTGG